MEKQLDTLDRLRELLGDSYRVEREIGRGGMAVVYLAEEIHPRRKVAIKVMNPEITSQVLRERFIREVDLASSLAHPHILPVFSAGVAEGMLYYVMPYIEGETLRGRLQRSGPLDRATALRLTAEIASALSHAHSAGIVHRDIKPENILLADGHALVADFGIARAVAGSDGDTALTRTGMPIGTPAYMSPEQWRGAAVDGRSDIYSLGCVVYEMLIGQPPASLPEERAVVAPSLPEVGTGLDRTTWRMIARAMAPRPADRYSDAQEFARDLSGAAEQRLAARVRRASLGVLAGVGAIAVLAIVGPKAARRPVEGRVAVAVFANQTGDSLLDPIGVMAADWIAQGLSRTGIVEVAGTREVMESDGAAPRGADAARLARQTGAGLIVTGAYYRQGDELSFVASITDPREDRVLLSLDPVSAPVGSPLDGVETVRRRIMGAMATRFDERFGSWAERYSQPPLYEAYEEYVRGQVALVSLRFPDAVNHFQHAEELDSGFVPARLMQAVTLAAMDAWGAADTLARRMTGLRSQLSDNDRALHDWILLTAAGRNEDALNAMLAGAGPDPADEVRLLIGNAALRSNHPRLAIEQLASMDPESPMVRDFAVYWVNYAQALHLLGAFEQELAAVRNGISRHPANQSLHGMEARALAALGRIDGLDSLFANYQPDVLPFWNSPGGGMNWAAYELEAHGYTVAARELRRAALEWFERQPAAQLAAEQVRYDHARVHYVTGDYWRSLVLFRQLRRARPDSVAYLGYQGAVGVSLGDSVLVRAVMDSLPSLQRPYTFGAAAYWQARIAALQGQATLAAEYAARAIDQGWFNHAAWHMADFASVRDSAVFARVTASKVR